MKQVWNKIGNVFTQAEVSYQVPLLSPGVYRVEWDERMARFFLVHTSTEFKFPYKVYGVETEFITRVNKTWNNTTGNMGVLLTGVRGTGKTVTAELIANQLNLPVIIVSENYAEFSGFLNNMQQDVIVFIDEYEKIYGNSHSLLSVMDGVMSTDHRVCFLLTTNSIYINDNMQQRPSRIRYVKIFEDLTLETIIEVVDDLLIHKEFREDTIKVISELSLITMDLVKTIVQEVNIHKESPEEFKDYLNVEGQDRELYNVYEMIDGKQKELYKNVQVLPTYISQFTEGETFYVGGKRLGYIEKVESKNQFSVANYDANDAVITHYLLEPVMKTHKAFRGSQLVDL